MTIDDIDIHQRGRGSSQINIEQTKPGEEQRITTKYARALFWQRVASIAWWMLVAPPLLGRYVVVAIVAVALWIWLKPHEAARLKDQLIGCAWVAIGAALVGVAIALGVLDAAWYPVWWGWHNGLMPLTVGGATVNLPAWFVWFRAFLIIAPPLAWDNSFRLASWRFVVEIVQPSASNPPVQPMRASSITHPRGSPVVPMDQDQEHVPPAPATTGDVIVRYVPDPGNGNGAGSHHAEMVIPLSIIARTGEHQTDTMRHTELLLTGLQVDGRASRSALTAYGLTADGARSLQAWMTTRGYAVDRNDGAGYVVTDLGRRWLSIAERHMPAF